jgi:hypothetical protein
MHDEFSYLSQNNSEQQLIRDLKITTMSYLAGIVDGEGCIGLEHLSPTKNRKKDYYVCRLTVVNTSEELMKLLVSSLKGQYDTRKKIEGRKTCYRWHVFGKDLEQAILALLPYLRIKKKQAKLVLEYRNTVASNGWLISDDVLAHRKTIWIECKKLNTIGG